LYQNKPVVQSGHKRLSKRRSERNLPSNETEKGRGTFLHCSTLTHPHTTSHTAHPKRFRRPREIYICTHAPALGADFLPRRSAVKAAASHKLNTSSPHSVPSPRRATCPLAVRLPPAAADPKPVALRARPARPAFSSVAGLSP
jgi:hypothetical protein